MFESCGICWIREISIQGKVTIPLVQSSTNCRIGWWYFGNIFLQLVKNQAHSWLTTAHAAPSPSPCIEISLNRVIQHVNKSPGFTLVVGSDVAVSAYNNFFVASYLIGFTNKYTLFQHKLTFLIV